MYFNNATHAWQDDGFKCWVCEDTVDEVNGHINEQLCQKDTQYKYIQSFNPLLHMFVIAMSALLIPPSIQYGKKTTTRKKERAMK